MVAGAEVIHKSIPVLDVQCRYIAKEIEEMVDFSAAAVAVVATAPLSPAFRQDARGSETAAAVNDAVSELVRFPPFLLSSWRALIESY